jgi:NAD(P)-dependent dehydrogenase (short-subunit alcohol dehydrogenase family)
MQSFHGKVAVVTGAASGIGRAIARRSAQEGMKVVLADINPHDLAGVEKEVRASGVEVLSVQTDVSQRADVEALAQRTVETFGAVHLLVNNAGVAAVGKMWESTWQDWEWMIGVNLWGVIHVVKIFTPIMLAQATECHIVNVASVAGLIATSSLGAYGVTKHGVVSLSESLARTLAEEGAKLKISVLCPGYVNTPIGYEGRNRPPSLQNDAAALSADRELKLQQLRDLLAAGMPPEEVAARVFDGVRNDQLYIVTHPEFGDFVRERMEAILAAHEALRTNT